MSQIRSDAEQVDSLVGGGVVSAGVTVKEKPLEVEPVKKLAEGVYVADTVYAPVASGCSGAKLYVTTPGPVLVTCRGCSASSDSTAAPLDCAV